jgi:uncharacterized membrane protein YebE (DUF533 family)
MDESRLLQGVLGSVLGGRRKKGKRALRYLSRGVGSSLLTNPTVLLTAAGLAWGVYETLQQGGQSGAGPATPQSGAGLGGPLPPLPTVGSSAAPLTDDALRIVRLAVSAAYADGSVSDEERAAILEQARAAGVSALVEQELAQPRPLAEIVTGVTDTAQRAALYVLAFGIVRGDEQPTGAERIYLAKLAQLLGLDPATVQQLEQKAAQGIEQQQAPERPETPTL